MSTSEKRTQAASAPGVPSPRHGSGNWQTSQRAFWPPLCVRELLLLLLGTNILMLKPWLLGIHSLLCSLKDFYSLVDHYLHLTVCLFLRVLRTKWVASAIARAFHACCNIMTKAYSQQTWEAGFELKRKKKVTCCGPASSPCRYLFLSNPRVGDAPGGREQPVLFPIADALSLWMLGTEVILALPSSLHVSVDGFLSHTAKRWFVLVSWRWGCDRLMESFQVPGRVSIAAANRFLGQILLFASS